MNPSPRRHLQPPGRTLEVITSHLNADFDAMASMVAAKKLYPDAILVFPGSQEPNLRDFFIRSSLYFLDFARSKNVPPEEIKRLILVDTRQASRIGKFAEAASSGEVDIHIYDHHPDAADDVHGSLEVLQPLGSTTAILTRLIKERGLTLTPQEATIMALGIFEDTGSFTFASTTPQDFEAAAFLLSQGADLNMVSEIITRELTAEQVALLNDLLEHSTNFHVSDIEVVIARATTQEYVPDFAMVCPQAHGHGEYPGALRPGPDGGPGLRGGPQPPAGGGRGRHPGGDGGWRPQPRGRRRHQGPAPGPGGGKAAPGPAANGCIRDARPGRSCPSR